ncbi:ruBisCO large subunit-binding protein subunit alpha, chloroplastic-like [Gossypium australe]|uniref:RuBisCO large subunit-binding protein subunit alpha, chloroplastic-like n=1 Tax=Gossypium australe TaxID=47621 RepID=A0A5B6X333_9ROSI|nr:ruBisCO large subunit-binding protein subunit alpha, chloroplastic-like [Gossypium australe]
MGNKNSSREQTARVEGRAPTRTYVIRGRKEASSPDVITEFTEFVIRVSNPLGKCVLVDRVCKGCPLMIRGHCFPPNLMLLPFDVIVNCGKKFIELKCESGDFIHVESDKQDRSLVVIYSLLTQKYLRKWYEAYIAFVMNTRET